MNKIVQIATGSYTYKNHENFNPKQETSHCIYALGDDGIVYKHHHDTNNWIPLLDKNNLAHYDK